MIVVSASAACRFAHLLASTAYADGRRLCRRLGALRAHTTSTDTDARRVGRAPRRRRDTPALYWERLWSRPPPRRLPSGSTHCAGCFAPLLWAYWRGILVLCDDSSALPCLTLPLVPQHRELRWTMLRFAAIRSSSSVRLQSRSSQWCSRPAASNVSSVRSALLNVLFCAAPHGSPAYIWLAPFLRLVQALRVCPLSYCKL